MPTHKERRVLPHTPEELFDLVADIERYPEFLPWCRGARIRRREGNVVIADLVIGFKIYRETYTSRVTLNRPDGIDVAYEKGPFRHLSNNWRFQPHSEGCEVDFYLDFEFRSRVLQAAMGMLFEEAVRRMVTAFTRRADAVYGREEDALPRRG
ncbi:MAG: type II toxin-antitoxin system RatA family toxin [Acetobacterales bacterium]